MWTDVNWKTSASCLENAEGEATVRYKLRPTDQQTDRETDRQIDR